MRNYKGYKIQKNGSYYSIYLGACLIERNIYSLELAQKSIDVYTGA